MRGDASRRRGDDQHAGTGGDGDRRHRRTHCGNGDPWTCAGCHPAGRDDTAAGGYTCAGLRDQRHDEGRDVVAHAAEQGLCGVDGEQAGRAASTWYLVQVGHYRDRAAAKAMESKLRSEEGLEAASVTAQ